MKILFRTLLVFACFASLASCKQTTGEKAVVGEAKKVVEKAMTGSSYGVDLAASKVMWTGSKLTGSTHTGTMNLSSGSLTSDNGAITGGEFVIDMNSVNTTDLEAGKGKEKLDGHLKSPDFFDVAAFPTAKFVITKVTTLDGDVDATHLVYGNLTLKDVTKEVGFKAKVTQGNGSVSVSTPKFVINRTDFNMQYGSQSFADIAKDKAISNDVELQINLTTKA